MIHCYSSAKPVAMNNHPAPRRRRPPRIVGLRTTTDILKQTTSIFSTPNNLLRFLLLSLFVLSLHANVETATNFLTSFIDNDSSIKSLIYRIQGPPNSTSPTSTITTRRRQRSRAIIPVTRTGLLNDDFYLGDDEFDRPIQKPKLNSTSFILDSFDPQLGFSNFVCDNGIRASEIVRSSANMTFRLIEIIEKEENVVINGSNDSAPFNEWVESKADSQSFLKRFDLELHEFVALLFLSVALTASYVFIEHGFVDTYTKLHGIVFVLVLNEFCERHDSFAITFLNSSFLGEERLHGFIRTILVIRNVLAQLFGLWFLYSIKDPYPLLKAIVRCLFMPFSTMSPWVKGFAKEIDDFQVSWILLEFFLSYEFVLVAWIYMASSRRRWREVVEEGCRLLSLMIFPAINLKFFELIICGRYARWVLTRHFGVLFAVALQSFMEVYFMVAWMVYYLSVKSIEANSSGQPFGQRELEAMLVDVR